MGVLAALSAIFGVLGAGFSIFQGVSRAKERQEEIWANKSAKCEKRK